MVMATPSPQQVGREFVRQYYTILHEAPQVLHRFYSSSSTFVHGGIDRPGHVELTLVGQIEIDKKIQQLNFKDCHTKIRQVDSQATVSDAVVVQVTGELSNNGEPMRRFMQTFVLVPQTPKKYYVHNDIFRYQDEVFNDNSDSESEDQSYQSNEKSRNSLKENEQNVLTEGVLSASEFDQNKNEESPSETIESSEQCDIQPAESIQQQQPVSMLQPQSLFSSSQGTVLSSQLHDNLQLRTSQINGHATGSLVDNQINTYLNGHEKLTETQKQPLIQHEEIQENNVETKCHVEKTTETLPTQSQQSGESIKSSWAKIIFNSSSSSNQIVSSQPNVNATIRPQSATQTSQPQQAPAKLANKANSQLRDRNQHVPPVKLNSEHSPTNTTNENGSMYTGGKQSRHSNRPKDSYQSKEARFNENNFGSSEDTEKRFGKFPDNHQIFVGNLQSDITEKELKAYFSQYGSVHEARINSNTKQQSARKLPNYGFIVFETKEAVEEVLKVSNETQLTMKNEKGVEYRLNIEEKRARQPLSSNQKPPRNNRSSSNSSRNKNSGIESHSSHARPVSAVKKPSVVTSNGTALNTLSRKP